MDFEELINFIVVIIFIGVALLVKLIEASSKKKRPFPEPIPEAPEELWPEPEMEKEPEAKAVKAPVKEPKTPRIKPETVIYKEEVTIPAAGFLSREDLQEGIVLSAILGPPRCISRWLPPRY